MVARSTTELKPLPHLRFISIAICASIMLAGCAKPPEKNARLTATQALPAHPTKTQTAQISKNGAILGVTDQEITTATLGTVTGTHNLVGRTIRVGSAADLNLRKGEVILTFDDGPSPRTTPLILAALKQFGVKATFFMVGNMARSHAAVARSVANSGHVIGNHTHGHENLAKLSTSGALKAVARGNSDITRAIKPTGKKVAPFFRFPYLSHTKVLRADLTDAGQVIFDVDVDSLDFRKQTPTKLLARTLARLDKKGQGIVLFHDIHMRTVTMLPKFLQALEERGYKVVHAVPKYNSLFDQTVLASLQ